MKNGDYILLTLERLIQTEEYLLIKEEDELKNMPKGTLVARKRKNNKWFYAQKENGKEIGITKDANKVLNLARKHHLLISSKKHIENISILNKTSKLINSNILKNQHSYTSPSHIQGIYSQKELHWINSIKSQNKYAPEHLIYICNNGLLVRSKSERIIVNKLLDYNVIFRYEALLEIDGSPHYPDFTILKKDGSVVLWEHFGLMSNEEYLVKSLQKIRKYKKIGFAQHKNLICTEEDDIRDESILDEIIYKFILS